METNFLELHEVELVDAYSAFATDTYDEIKTMLAHQNFWKWDTSSGKRKYPK